MDPPDENAATRVRARSESASSESLQASFVAGHMRRTRWMVGIIFAVAGMGGAVMLALGGPLTGQVMMGAGLVIVTAAALSLASLTADPSRFDVARGLISWIGLALGVSLVSAYFGAASATAAVHVLAITFVTMAHDSRIGLWTMVTSALTTFALGVAVASGLLDEPGILRIGHHGTAAQLVIVTAACGVIVASYVVASASRRATRETVEELEAATRAVARREALLEEARLELDRARRAGERGRFSDQVLGSFRIGPLLGRGGMGEVYEGEHVVTGEPAAIKLLRRDSLSDPRALARFDREIQLLASLRAPHIVRVIEVGGADAPLPYIAMERLNGRDLASILRETPMLEHERVVELVTQVALGLDAAHAHGVVHRDIKPQNLVWQPGTDGAPGSWSIIDFGVARTLLDGGELTAERVIGTPAYMAPEQATAGEVGASADRYALAVVAFRALTSELPHRGADPMTLLRRIATEPARLPSQVERGLPDEVDQVFAIALARDPGERFASCAELAAALRDALAERLPARLAARGLALLHRQQQARWLVQHPRRRERSRTGP